MASVSTFSFSRPNTPLPFSSYPSSSSSPLQFQLPYIKSQTQFRNPPISCFSSVVKFGKHSFLRPKKVRALAEEEEALVPEEETSPPPATDAPDQTVSVAVSPSDMLMMFFQAEGTMPDSAIPAVTKALEEVEGITDLKVQVSEVYKANNRTSHRSGFKFGRDNTRLRLQVANVEFELPR